MPGSVTIDRSIIKSDQEWVYEYVFSWVADASDGSVPDTQTPFTIVGWVFMGEVVPGSPSPTAAYNIEVLDSRGVDVFGGKLLNQSASDSYQTFPQVGDAYGDRFVSSPLTLSITNNSVNSAKGEVRVLIRL